MFDVFNTIATALDFYIQAIDFSMIFINPFSHTVSTGWAFHYDLFAFLNMLIIIFFYYFLTTPFAFHH